MRLYHGETARNLHVRSKEHCNAYKNKSEKSFMNKHVIHEHEGNTDGVKFDWRIVGKFKKPLPRQLTEAIKIDNKTNDESLNTKTEYFQHTTKRLGIEGREDKEECAFCGRKFGRIKELQEHEKDFHTKNTCTICKKDFFGKKSLMYHIEDKHKQQAARL